MCHTTDTIDQYTTQTFYFGLPHKGVFVRALDRAAPYRQLVRPKSSLPCTEF
jgi:hypothetical protein